MDGCAMKPKGSLPGYHHHHHHHLRLNTYTYTHLWDILTLKLFKSNPHLSNVRDDTAPMMILNDDVDDELGRLILLLSYFNNGVSYILMTPVSMR